MSAWPVLVSLWLVFTVTFVVFPGAFFLSHFRFMDGSKAEFEWYAQIVILTFNVMDTLGRKMGGLFTLSPCMAYFLAVLRIGFILTTIFVATMELHPDNFLESDSFKVLNLVIFSFTNGFVSTLLSIYVP